MPATPTPNTAAETIDLGRHRRDFLQGLVEQGYAASTLRQYELKTNRFVTEAGRLRRQERVLDSKTVQELRSKIVAALNGSTRRQAAFHLTKFIAYLVEVGVAERQPPPPEPTTPRDLLRREYETYLRVQRGVSESTVRHATLLGERFLKFRFGEGLGDLNQITPDDLVNFLVQIAVGAPRTKTNPTHLRRFCQFLFWSGKTTKDLADSVPRVVQQPPRNLPRYLSPDEVRQLINAVRTDDAIGRRNYAMLLLMARLGLRATEVIAIQLEDIDWRAGELLVRGKGKLHDRMPLPAEVGAGLADYLRRGRKGKSRTLFVSQKAPHGPFVDGQIVNDLLRKAFAKTGLKPPQKYVGSHLLRHSLATGMLRGGASLDEIGDTLRHRSRMTTTIYAKLDLEGLRSIAREWPEPGGMA